MTRPLLPFHEPQSLQNLTRTKTPLSLSPPSFSFPLPLPFPLPLSTPPQTVKLASCKYLDGLPTSGNKYGRAFRDLEWEAKVLEMTRTAGIGAQFGGKYFCHDVRVIRLPR